MGPQNKLGGSCFLRENNNGNKPMEQRVQKLEGSVVCHRDRLTTLEAYGKVNIKTLDRIETSLNEHVRKERTTKDSVMTFAIFALGSGVLGLVVYIFQTHTG